MATPEQTHRNGKENRTLCRFWCDDDVERIEIVLMADRGIILRSTHRVLIEDAALEGDGVGCEVGTVHGIRERDHQVKLAQFQKRRIGTEEGDVGVVVEGDGCAVGKVTIASVHRLATKTVVGLDVTLLTPRDSGDTSEGLGVSAKSSGSQVDHCPRIGDVVDCNCHCLSEFKR